MPKQVLVIDDDQSLRLLYSTELTDAGFAVDTASDGNEGLEMVKRRHYDLIVLDIEMPDMDGLEVLNRLRTTAPQTKVLLNSAYSTYKADFQSWLADEYLVKSSDLKPLVDKLRRLAKGE